MTNLSFGASLNKRLDSLRASHSSTPEIAISVEKFAPITNTAGRVMFSARGNVDKANFKYAVEEAFGHRLRYLKDSAHRPSLENAHLISAFLSVNKPKRGLDTVALAGLQMVTANVFADPKTDQIWRKVGEGEGAYLVQDTEDDLASLLVSRQGKSIDTASVSIALEEPFQAGDAILWYDLDKETANCGLAVSEGLVLAFDDRTKFLEVSASQVLVVHEGTEDLADKVDIANTAGLMAQEKADIFTPAVSQPLPPYTPAVPNYGQGKIAQIMNLIQDRSPLTPETLVQRHLAYMSVIYANNEVRMQHLRDLLTSTYMQRMQLR